MPIAHAHHPLGFSFPSALPFKAFRSRIISRATHRKHALSVQKLYNTSSSFQGWLLRSIDHDHSLSFMVIIGAYSPKFSRAYSQHYIYLSVHTPEGFFYAHKVLSPGDISISETSATELSLLWKSQRHGVIMLTPSMCRVNVTVDGLRIESNSTSSLHWAEDSALSNGPEGWLGRTCLLPCKYFVHSLGSPTDYVLTIKNKSSPKQLSGHALTHIEGNSGNSFPRGWIWSQGMDKLAKHSVLIVGGIFSVGPVEIKSWVISIRIPDKSPLTFRTTDLHKIQYYCDPSAGFIDVTAQSRQYKVNVFIESNMSASQFESPTVFTPSADGFNQNLNCRETFTAIAKVKVVNKDNIVGGNVSFEVPFTALEFGGILREAVFKS